MQIERLSGDDGSRKPAGLGALSHRVEPAGIADLPTVTGRDPFGDAQKPADHPVAGLALSFGFSNCTHAPLERICGSGVLPA